MEKSVTAFIICLLAAIHLASGRCPDNEEFRKHCSCDMKFFSEVECIGLNETNFDRVVGLLKNKPLYKLTLEQSNIKTLCYKTFNNTDISVLIIKNSSLEFIEKGTLGSIKGLSEMDILRTNLQRIPDISNAPELNHLAILSANISSIGPTDISPSNSLRVLRIAFSKVVQVKENAFCGLKGLKTINLIGNKLTELPKNLTCSQSLKYVNLKFNELKRIEFETFENNKRLEYMELNYNPIDNLSYSKVFEDMILRGTAINLKHTQLTCNKSLCWLANIIESNEDKYIKLWGECKYPGIDKSREWRFLKPEHLNC